MAFSKQNSATLVSSASLVYSNLSVQSELVNDAITFGVIHKSTLNIAHTSNSPLDCAEEEVVYDDSGNKDPLSHILQVSSTKYSVKLYEVHCVRTTTLLRFVFQRAYLDRTR